MLHEYKRDRTLEQDHRNDHDEERALIKALRQHLRQAARRVAPKHADLREHPQLLKREPFAHRSATSRYPAPRAVCRYTGLVGSCSILRRKRLTRTSTVRS